MEYSKDGRREVFSDKDLFLVSTLASEALDEGALASRLGAFVDFYEAWIDSQPLTGVEPAFKADAARIVGRSKRSAQRMREGARLLAGDPVAFKAFKLANRAMLFSMANAKRASGPGRMAEVAYRAVARSRWCSSDPVCRELEEQGVGGLNRAACHACSLVAETSCAYANAMLNRTLVSGTGKANASGVIEPLGFFTNVLEG